MDNRAIARKLLGYANFLEGRESSVYRVRAYRRAAQTVLSLDRPVSQIVATDGRKGLESLPGIGRRLSYTLDCLATTGEFLTMDGNRGHVDPENLLTSLPSIGPRLARRIHHRYGIDTLEELERAAHDGRLRELGIGSKRLRGLIDALAGRLGRFRLGEPLIGEPGVADLLAVDRAYRDQSAQHLLPLLTPRRFNPNHQPWLPLLKTKKGGWRFRALYSNTALAHRLNQTSDWVVIYFHDGQTRGQRTIVTETRGDLRGRRVVRGRERECRGHYQQERQGQVLPSGQPALPFAPALSDAAANG